jgi:anaerobic selenocysteine-containing dehydrogenase
MVPAPTGHYMSNRRLRAIQARGGGIVVVAPRRTQTTGEVDEWVSIRWRKR